MSAPVKNEEEEGVCGWKIKEGSIIKGVRLH